MQLRFKRTHHPTVRLMMILFDRELLNEYQSRKIASLIHEASEVVLDEAESDVDEKLGVKRAQEAVLHFFTICSVWRAEKRVIITSLT